MISTVPEELDKFTKSHIANVNDTCESIRTICAEVGYATREDLITYNQRMLEAVLNNLLDVVVSDAEQVRTQLTESDQEIRTLCNDLKYTAEDYLIPTGTILERSKGQVEHWASLEKIKQDRLSTFKQLQEKELYLLERLNWLNRLELRYVAESPENTIPTERTLTEFTQHADELQQRVDKRENALSERKSSCIDILSQIEETPDAVSQFAHDFIYSNEFHDLGDDFVRNANNVYSEILGLKEKRQSEIEGMVTKISNIINRLQLADDIPETDNLSKSHFTTCAEQLERLEELKKASLGEMIEQMHLEIEKLEEDCFISELEVIKFDRQVYTKCVTKEDQLDALENRADYLKQLQSTHIELYESVRKWKICFDDLMVIEENQRDKSRLFSNRGGALLAETKKKKRLLHQLPKLQTAALEAAASFGASCPRLNGCSDVLDFLMTLQHEAEADREAEREVKKAQKQQQLQQESMFGVNTSSLKRGARKPLPNSAKRTRNHESGQNSTVSKASSARTTSTASSRGSANRTGSQNRNKGGFKAPTPLKEMSTPVVQQPKSKGGFGFRAGGAMGSKRSGLQPSSAERGMQQSRNVGRVRCGKDRRSKTPDRLLGNKRAPLKMINRLPSSGLRRRSKSVSQLNTISERFGTPGRQNCKYGVWK